MLDPPDGRGQTLGVGVVLGQTLDVMLQGIEGRGGEDARLTHAAAEHLAMPPGLGDHFASGRPTPSRPAPPAPC